MSMLNLDGQLVVTALLNQQAGDVARELLQHRRDMKAADLQHQQHFADQQRYAWLVAKYNDLADRFNRVLADNKRVDAAHADALADKDRRIAKLAAQNAELEEYLESAHKSAMNAFRDIEAIRDGIKRHNIEMGEAWPAHLKPPIEF